MPTKGITCIPCPYCHHPRTRVSQTVGEIDPNTGKIIATKRRRRCEKCGLYFTSKESPCEVFEVYRYTKLQT